MDYTRLNESDTYRSQREELRVAELDLMEHVERVAALRRELPPTRLSTTTSWSMLRLATAYAFPNYSAHRTGR
jgi:predicted dithiol-disulfide oxidoreductase (DUF899 family)